jgi:hypothetical protein
MAEFRRFIALKVFVADNDALVLSLTELIDDLWHEVLLDTRFYADLQQALNCVIHHRPSGAGEYAAKWTRLMAMKSLYAGFFGDKPVEIDDWRHKEGSKSIRILMTGGHSWSFYADSSTNVKRLRNVVSSMMKIPVDDLRMRYNGLDVLSGSTLKGHDIREGGVIHCRGAMRGC